MEAALSEREIQAQGLSETHTSSIYATPQMFEILSNQLYTDKPAAIVRELVCNAIDAHLEAGTDEAVQIHLPSFLEPHFEVRDFGTGIDPAEVPDRMMSFGGGHKSTASDLIGAFGLGMKSPWSLTDQFTIETRWHGRKVLFSAYIQADGRPGCAQMSNTETDEPNGVTVYVPLKQAHVSDPSFRRMLEAIYARSPVPLYVIPASEWQPQDLESPAFTIDELSNHAHRLEIRSGSAPMIVTMGPVPYRIDNRAIYERAKTRYSDEDNGFSLYKAMLHRFQFELHMQLGSVQVTASREQISQDEQTLTRIADSLIDGLRQLHQRLEAAQQNPSSFYEWLIAGQYIGKTGIVPNQWHDYVDSLGRIQIGGLFQPVAKYRTMVDHQPGYKRCYKSHPQRSLISLRELEETVVLASSTHHGYQEYLTQQFPWWRFESAIIVQGNPDDVQQHLHQLGLSTPVWELPQPSASRNRSTRSLGAAHYSIEILEQGNQYLDVARTAQELLDDFDGQLLIYPSSKRWVSGPIPIDIARAINSGLARPATGLRQVAVVGIPASHKRVRQRLCDELGAEVVFNDTQLANELHQHLTFNYNQVIRYAAHYRVREELKNLCRLRLSTSTDYQKSWSETQIASVRHLLDTLSEYGVQHADRLAQHYTTLCKWYCNLTPSRLETHAADLIARADQHEWIRHKADERAQRLLRRMLPSIARQTWPLVHINRFIPGLSHLLKHRWMADERESIALTIKELTQTCGR